MTPNSCEAPPACIVQDCERPASASSKICAPHVERLGDWLARLQGEYELLSATPSMQGREFGSVGSGTLASQRSVGIEAVMVLRDRRSREQSAADPDGNGLRSVYEVLHAYAEGVREGRDLVRPVRHVEACRFPCMHQACILGVGHAVPVPLTISTERRLLAAHLSWIVAQDFADDFYADIKKLWDDLRHANEHAVNGLEPRRSARSTSRCRLTVQGAPCGGRVRLVDTTATCNSCGATASGLDIIRQHTEGAVA